MTYPFFVNATYERALKNQKRRVTRLGVFFLLNSNLDHVHAHTACSTGDDGCGMCYIVSIHVFHLVLGDRFDLHLGDLAYFLTVRLGRTLLDTCGLEYELARRWLLDHKSKRAVLVHMHQDREDRACLGAGLIIELLDEFGDIDARRAKCGTYRRSRRGSPRWELELYDLGDFFCHMSGHYTGMAGDFKGPPLVYEKTLPPS